jgi:hypothetical protein
MYELKLERYLRVNLLGPGPSSYKKNYLPGRGLTKVGKHSNIPSAVSVAPLEVEKVILETCKRPLILNKLNKECITLVSLH